MRRTALKDRVLPDYTKGEEIFNMVTHIVGGTLGIAALVLCVVFAALHKNPWGVVSAAIYGASLVTLYTISSIYHGLHKGTGKKVLQILDHCMIFFLIAGTYTPYTLSGLRVTHPVIAWVIFGLVWGLAALGITLNAIDLKKYAKFSMACYIGMGWCIIAAFKPMVDAFETGAIIFLLLGGIAYTVGAVLYGIGKKRRYMHSIFHLFVIVGSVMQFFSIFFYLM